MKKLSALCLMLVLVPSLAYGQAAVTPQVPDEVVALAEVRNPQRLSVKIQNLVQQLDPTAMVPPMIMLLPMAVMKTQNPYSVDLEKPLQVVVLQPPLHTSPVLVFGLKDPAAYLDSLLPNIQKTRDEGDVHVYRETAAQFGMAPTEGAGEGQLLVIGTAGKRAALGQDVEAVKKVTGLMKTGTLTAKAVFWAEDIGAVARPGKLLDALAAIGENPFEMMRNEAIANLGGGAPANQQAATEAFIGALENASRQCDSIFGGISLGKTAVSFSSGVDPAAGSGLAGYLAGVPKGKLELLKHMPADSAVLFATKLGDLGPFLDWYARVMENMLTIAPGAADTTGLEALTDILREFAGLLGEEMAVAGRVSAGQSLRMAEAIAVKDAARAKELLESSPQKLQAFMDAQGMQTGMTTKTVVRPDAITHQGQKITEWQINLETTAAGLDPALQGVAELQQRMMGFMMGPEGKFFTAFLGNTLLYTTGDDALPAMKELIDGMAQSAANSTRLMSALQGMPKEPMSIGYASLGECANWCVGLLEQTTDAMPVPLPLSLENLQFESGPPVGMASWIEGENILKSRVRVPVRAIKGLVDGFKKGLVPAGGVGQIGPEGVGY